MNVIELTEYLIKNIAKDPDSVSVKGFDAEDETIIEVLVSKDDIGRIIGKDGKMISAIRMIVNAATYEKNKKKAKINIDSI